MNQQQEEDVKKDKVIEHRGCLVYLRSKRAEHVRLKTVYQDDERYFIKHQKEEVDVYFCEDCKKWEKVKTCRIFTMGELPFSLLVSKEKEEQNMAKKIVKIGEIGVDAGLVWIGDPCYFWERGTAQKKIGESWRQFCETLINIPYPKHKSYDLLGVVATSGVGDGVYPVYAEIEDNTITSITVKFVDDDEEEDA